jgi:hypothetical protein
MSAKAETIINKVDLGVWKFNHTSWNRKFMRREYKFICPTIKRIQCVLMTELSTARIDVVPAAQYRCVLHRLHITSFLSDF